MSEELREKIAHVYRKCLLGFLAAQSNDTVIKNSYVYADAVIDALSMDEKLSYYRIAERDITIERLSNALANLIGEYTCGEHFTGHNQSPWAETLEVWKAAGDALRSP